jgi:hypothetical protein
MGSLFDGFGFTQSEGTVAILPFAAGFKDIHALVPFQNVAALGNFAGSFKASMH